MISWLLVTIIAYVFFSLAFFGDKLVLSGPPKPELYTFYVGSLNVLVIFLLPFTPLALYTANGLLWAFLTALVSLGGLYTMFYALQKYEVSRVMSTIGAVQPLMILALTGIVWGFTALTQTNLLAFILLLAGSIVISFEKKLALTLRYSAITLGSSLLFSLAYVFSKLVFLDMEFLPGLASVGMFTFAFSLALLLANSSLRQQVFAKKPIMDKKTGILFLVTQSAGGIANLLQSLAISLVPVSSLALVNSLRGVQYVFLFIVTLFFSLFYPKIFKEDISRKIMIQKIAAIALIVVGLAILI